MKRSPMPPRKTPLKRTAMKAGRRITAKQRALANFDCEDCGATFERRSDHKSRAADGKMRCKSCSYKARYRRTDYSDQLTGEYLTCARCGAEFYRNPSRIRGKISFCSSECHFADQRDRSEWPGTRSDNRGTKNPAYRHGRKVGHGSANKRKVRDEVIERDGGDYCALCGTPGPGLDLHRIIYGSQGGKYETDNCIQLCRLHHVGTVHGGAKKTWQPRLLAVVRGEAPFRSLHQFFIEEVA